MAESDLYVLRRYRVQFDVRDLLSCTGIRDMVILDDVTWNGKKCNSGPDVQNIYRKKERRSK